MAGAKIARISSAVVALALCLFLAPVAPLMAAVTTAAACAVSRIAALPLELVENVPIVTLQVESEPVSLVLDTGAERSMISTEAAKRLRLIVRSAYPLSIAGVGGSVSTGEARLDHISAGGRALASARVRVGAIAFPVSGRRPTEGLLGTDVLSDYDVDIDLQSHEATLYSPTGCEAPAWKGRYASVTAARSLHNRLFFPVRLDGRNLAAFVDTGAQLSVLDAKAAQATGATQAMLDHDRAFSLRGAGAWTLPARRHVFERLEIADDVNRDIALLVARLGLEDADLVLGMNYLATRRVWLSWASRTVFITHDD